MTCNTWIRPSDLSSIYGKENFNVAYKPRIYLISLLSFYILIRMMCNIRIRRSHPLMTDLGLGEKL
jgi:hypothetical protein